jgi:hypothetical protein
MLAVAIAAASSPSASTAFDKGPAFDQRSGARPGIRKPPPHDIDHPTSRECPIRAGGQRSNGNGASTRAACGFGIGEYDSGNIEAAILLVNSMHSQRWQSPLYTHPVCLVDHRIKFIAGDGVAENRSPTFQNMFVYLGEDIERFAEVFRQFGYVRIEARPKPMPLEKAAHTPNCPMQRGMRSFASFSQRCPIRGGPSCATTRIDAGAMQRSS